ncbi:uncharacterized protein CDAR_453751, partial [Caerostris darwini]
MENKTRITLDKMGFDKHLEQLTPSQQQFTTLLSDWIDRPRNMITLISGGPGTGKTHVVTTSLDFVKNATQLRMAYTARIAQQIGGRTMHSSLLMAWGETSLLRTLEKQLENETNVDACLNASALLKDSLCYEGACPSIIIVDEIGMIPYWLLYWIIRYFMDETEKPILFVGMGDSHQLRPVKSNNNLFGVECVERDFETHRIELVESKRFHRDYEPVIETLKQFVNKRDVAGLFNYIAQVFPVVPEINASHLQKCQKALSFKNNSVDTYNNYYLKKILPGKTIRLYAYDSFSNEPIKDSFVDVKPSCKVYVTQNGFSDVVNGTLLIFKTYVSSKDVVRCLNPKNNATVDVRRNHQGKFPLVLGFASTVHKFQGFTIDDPAIVINFDGSDDLNLVYTALSRVRSMEQILAIA